MKQVVVYVEGPSDKAVLGTILAKLIEQKSYKQTFIKFQDPGGGDRKSQLLTNIPNRAADQIAADPRIHVAIMPDLYPKNKGFPHQDFQEMQAGILQQFRRRLSQKGFTDTAFLEQRFKVFCFKHDLESLLLAASKEMLGYLRLAKTSVKWAVPVENQNFNQPPKIIVQKIFQEAKTTYQETVDAIQILSGVELEFLADQCSQCFKPFVDYLRNC